METEYLPEKLYPLVLRRNCRAAAERRACRTRPSSRPCARSWAAGPAPGTARPGSGAAGGGTGGGAASGLDASRPRTADPIGTRGGRADPAPRHRGSVPRVPPAPAGPPQPAEKKIDSWSRGSESNVRTTTKGGSGSGSDAAAGSGARRREDGDGGTLDVHETLREKLAAGGRFHAVAGPQRRLQTADEASVRTASTTTTTNTSISSAPTSQAASQTTSLAALGTQPERVEAGTDPVAELGVDDDNVARMMSRRPRRGRRRDAITGVARDGVSARHNHHLIPSRYRVPMHEYQPALQGRRTRSERRVARGTAQGVNGHRRAHQRQRSAGSDGRRRRLERLAQPNYRRDIRANKTAAERPNLSVGPEPIWPISRAALRALPTPRVSRLSIAPSRRSELRTDASRSRAHTAHSSTQTAAPGCVSSRLSARLEELSKPRQPRVRPQAFGSQHSQRRLLTDADWRRHREWLQVNAKPRKDHSLKQREVRRGRSASLRRLLPRLRVLAQPSKRAISIKRQSDVQMKTASTVSQSALRYRPTEHIIQLSKPLHRRLSSIKR